MTSIALVRARNVIIILLWTLSCSRSVTQPVDEQAEPAETAHPEPSEVTQLEPPGKAHLILVSDSGGGVAPDAQVQNILSYLRSDLELGGYSVTARSIREILHSRESAWEGHLGF